MVEKLKYSNLAGLGVAVALIEAIYFTSYYKALFNIWSPSLKQKSFVYILPFKKYHPAILHYGLRIKFRVLNLNFLLKSIVGFGLFGSLAGFGQPSHLNFCLGIKLRDIGFDVQQRRPVDDIDVLDLNDTPFNRIKLDD